MAPLNALQMKPSGSFKIQVKGIDLPANLIPEAMAGIRSCFRTFYQGGNNFSVFRQVF